MDSIQTMISELLDIQEQAQDGSENHLGAVGGHTVTRQVTPLLTVGGTYAANDYIGTSAQATELVGAARVDGGSGTIVSAALYDAALQSVAGELWVFTEPVTPPADSAAWSISDADNKKCAGVIPFSTYYASALNSIAPTANVGIWFKLMSGTSLFLCYVTRGAPTTVAGSLTFGLTIAQD